MNVTEVKNTLTEQTHRKLDAIFDRQMELMSKYHPIEEANGLLFGHEDAISLTVDLDNRFGQFRLKDMAWRFTEELGEADAAFVDYQRDNGSKLHFQEECIDALHFLVELSVISGFVPETMKHHWPHGGQHGQLLDSMFSSVSKIPGTWPDSAWASVASLGMTMNCLKNKPWKQSHQVTDRRQFYYHLGGTWLRFVGALHLAELTADTTFDLYVRKSEVNKFRQRSQY